MAYDNCQMFATIGAADREEAACAECAVTLKLLYVRNEFHITQLKLLGIIEQGTIDASHVGSLYVAILVASFPVSYTPLKLPTILRV